MMRNDGSLRRRLVVVALTAVATVSAMAAPAARAGCGLLGLNVLCTGAPPAPAYQPPPDPGGSESPDQPVPVPGKGWGFNLGYQPAGDRTADTSLTAMQALGVNLLRDVVGWNALAGTSPGTPVTAEMRTPVGSLPAGSSVARWDQEYIDLTSRGITPIFILQNVPTWASTLHRCLDGYYAFWHSIQCPSGWHAEVQYPDPQFYWQWREWVTAVAHRYPKAVIEGPNEPDYASDNYRPGAVGPWTAGEIQCQLFEAVRSVDHRTVLSMAQSDVNYERTFIGRAKGCYDAFSWHLYPRDFSFGTGTGVAAEFAKVRGVRSAAGDTTPIWVTETGYSFAPGGGAAYDALATKIYTDSSRRLYNRLMTMSDVAAVMFHTLRDRPIGNTDAFGFFDAAWAPKAVACQFLKMRGTSWPGC
jgi:hypothetical protein